MPSPGELGRCLHADHLLFVPQLDLKSYVATIEYTETEEEENNVKILDLIKSGEIAFSEPIPMLAAPRIMLRLAVRYTCALALPTCTPALVPTIMAASAINSSSSLHANCPVLSHRPPAVQARAR